MRSNMNWLLVVATLFFISVPVEAQEDELELIESVTSLQQKLNSDVVADRQLAEKELIELGPAILEYLDPVTEDATTDFSERVTRIRTTLEKKTADLAAQASTISLSGTMTVGEALEKLKRKTGNVVAVADDSQLDKSITLDLKDAEFWAVMEAIMNQAGLMVDRYGSEKPGQLMLNSRGPKAKAIEPPTSHSRIFQTQVLRVDSSVNLLQPQLDFTTVNLLVRWEPRLRPISVDIPMRSVKVVDEFGDSLQVAQPEQVIYGMVPVSYTHLTLPTIYSV